MSTERPRQQRSYETLIDLPEVELPQRVPQLSRVESSGIDGMDLAVLLAEGHALKAAEARLKAVKSAIRDKLHAEGWIGARCGASCAMVRWMDGRRSLSRELLVEAGVTAEQLDAGMKAGEGYWMCELPSMIGD